MQMDTLHMFNISNLSKDMFARQKHVRYNLILEFAEYQKSPEKPSKVPEVETKPVDLGRQWNSRLRLYLWAQLRKLYEAYVLGKSLTINDQNLRGLVTSILG